MPTLPHGLGLALFLLVAIVLASGGWALVRGLLRERDGLFALTGGLFVGPGLWLALLNAFAHTGRFPLALALASAVWLALVGVSIARAPRLHRPSRRTLAIGAGQVAALLAVGAVALANRQWGGYLDEYWVLSLASTIARGNIPPVAPFSPDLPAAYHYGVAMGGAGVHVLTGLDYVAVFELLAAAVQAAFFMLVGHLLWRLPLGRWVAPLMATWLLSLGFMFRGAQPWLLRIVVPGGLPTAGLRTTLTDIYTGSRIDPVPPPFGGWERYVGAGPPNVQQLQFPIALGVGLVALWYVHRASETGEASRAGVVLLGVLLGTLTLLESTVAAAFGVSVAVVLLLRIGAGGRWKTPASALAISVPIAVLGGGLLSDSLLRGTAGGSGLTLSPDLSQERLWAGQARQLAGGVVLLDVALWPLLAMGLAIAALTRNRLAAALGLSGLAVWFGFLLTSYTYFPPDSERLTMLASILTALALGVGVASVRARLRPWQPASVALSVLGLAVWPSASQLAVPTFANVTHGVQLTPGLTAQAPSAESPRTNHGVVVADSWDALQAAGRLPDRTRVLTHEASAFVMATGLLAPFGPRSGVDMFNQAGPVYLDAWRTLAPAALEQLRVTHVHASADGVAALRPAAREMLASPARYTPLHGVPGSEGLYRIEAPALVGEPWPPDTYLELDALIPSDARVYVSPAIEEHARVRILYLLRDRVLHGEYPYGIYHLRLPIEVRPYVSGTALDYVLLPTARLPSTLGLRRADAMWDNGDARAYRLDPAALDTASAMGTAPERRELTPPDDMHVLIRSTGTVEGLVRIELAYRRPAEGPAFTGVEWVVMQADSEPLHEPKRRAGRQWFEGQIVADAPAQRLVLEYDHRAGVMWVMEGPNAPAPVGGSQPRDVDGPWVLALRFTVGGTVWRDVLVAGIEAEPNGRLRITPWSTSDRLD